MVTTTFKKPQAALKLALPESTQATKVGSNENPPLVVSIEENGTLRLGDEAKPVTLEQLKNELGTEAAKNPQLKLTISADKKAPFGQIVKVMDAAKEVNIRSV